MLAMLVAALDQTIVATALPQIVSSLKGLSYFSWVTTAYLLTSTVTVPIYGKLSDIYGRRGLFLLSIGIFLVGSMLSGLSQNMTELILFRGLQGIGAGAMMVNAMAVIGDIFTPQERGRYQGFMGGIFGLATIIGPFLGGWITDHYSWHWIFYINVPIGILAIAVLASSMPKIVHNIKDRSIDYLGALLIMVFLVPLLLAFVWGGSQYPWGSWQIIGLFVVAVAALVGFVITEHKVHEPILSPSLFRNKVFTYSNLAVFFSAMGMFGAIMFIPLFAQGVVGISATNSGAILMPMMIGMMITSAVGGQIISRSGNYKILGIIGMTIATIGVFLFVNVGIATSSTTLTLRMIILGMGLGATMPIFILAVQNAFPRERLGELTAAVQLFRSLGGTVGTAIFGGVMNAELASRLTNIQNTPFVSDVAQLPGGAAISQVNGNTLQGFLSPAGQAQIRALISQVPANLQGQINSDFNQFLATIKSAVSISIDHIYTIGAVLMVLAVISVIFLPQISLHPSKRPALEEAAVELDEELGLSDKAHEPEI